jgi:hypothetical protein
VAGELRRDDIRFCRLWSRKARCETWSSADPTIVGRGLCFEQGDRIKVGVRDCGFRDDQCHFCVLLLVLFR